MVGDVQDVRLPEAWEISTLGNDAVIKGRIGWRGYQKSDLRESGPVVIGGINIKSRLYLDLSDIKHLSRQKYEESPDIHLKQGDVLLVQRGNGLGETAYFDGSIPEATINPTLIILSDFKGDPRFLFYYLSSPVGRKSVLALASGSSIPALYQNHLKRLRYPKPPLPEQRAIAHILGTLDDKIELNRRMNETLEGMARAIFKSWFVDFEPVRAKDESRDPGLPQSIADLFPHRFKDSEMGDIPEGWEVRSLDEIASFLNGLALQKYPPKDGRSLPVIKIAQLRAGHTSGAELASADLEPDYIVQDGDILFSWSGSLECVLWAGGPGALNQHLFKVTSVHYPRWLCYLGIHQHLDEFRHIAAGKATTMGHIQRHHLSGAKLSVPSPELLRAMDAVIQPIIESTWRREVQSRTLGTIRDTLLPKLISGELRVKDAVRLIERTI